MIGLIICGHNHYGDGVLSSLEMIAGRSAEVVAINFLETDNLDDLAKSFENKINALKENCEGVLISCDLAGGTPFNTAVLASKNDEDVVVIAGANLASLLQLSIMRYQYTSAQEFAALAEVQENFIVQFKAASKKVSDEGGI